MGPKALPTFRFPDGTCIAQAQPRQHPAVTLESPALSVMTDLTEVRAATVAPGMSLHQAELEMIHQGVRMLFVVAPDFTGFDAGAMWDDCMLGIRHISGLDRVALVTDVPWLRAAAKATRLLVPADFRLFALAELEQAARWIAEPADG